MNYRASPHVRWPVVGYRYPQLDRVGQLPRIVWPSDVDREKARLDPFFRSTDAAADACRTRAAGDVRAARILDGWQTFYGRWRAFADSKTPTFGSANQWDLSQQYAGDLQGWQAAVTALCGPTGTPDVRPTDDPKDRYDLGTPIKWVAIAVIAASAAYGATQFARAKGWLGT